MARVLPGEQLGRVTSLGARTLLLQLRERGQTVLRLPAEQDRWAGAPHEAEAIALQVLRYELEPAFPELLAHEPGPAGFTLLSYCQGEPLPALIDQLDEEQRYAIGRRLGELIGRVHAYGVAAYGPLAADQPPQLSRVVREPQAMPRPRLPFQRGEAIVPGPGGPPDQRDLQYLLERLGHGLDLATAEQRLTVAGAERIAGWVAENLATTGQPPCLTHGDLAPERVLLRRRDRSWTVSGLVGWGMALAWRPAWDHVTMLGAFAESRYFSVRAGYGNAYDATTERNYDQLRDFALLPYRIVLALEAGRPDLAVGMVSADIS